MHPLLVILLAAAALCGGIFLLALLISAVMAFIGIRRKDAPGPDADGQDAEEG